MGTRWNYDVLPKPAIGICRSRAQSTIELSLQGRQDYMPLQTNYLWKYQGLEIIKEPGSRIVHSPQ